MNGLILPRRLAGNDEAATQIPRGLRRSMQSGFPASSKVRYEFLRRVDDRVAVSGLRWLALDFLVL